MAIKGETYVEAARSLGASDAYIVFRHLIPNGFAPVLVSAMLATGDAIILEATLGLLGPWRAATNPQLGRDDVIGHSAFVQGSVDHPVPRSCRRHHRNCHQPVRRCPDPRLGHPRTVEAIVMLLEVENLDVGIGKVQPLSRISLRVKRRQILGLVGDSGSG
jgi:ABC-type multidrug transport system fused ATPase/permease subunit